MTSQTLSKLKLPDTPGVYVFRDRNKRPLYIGRATSLADRVKSYFAADIIVTRGPRIVDMVTKAVTVTWEPTDSVLEAIILESNLIKKYQPHYNVDERDDKSSQYVVITDETWPRVFLVRARDLDTQQKEGTLPYTIQALFGPYPHGGLIKEALKILRKMFPFRDKKSFDERHNLFYQSLGRSPRSDDTEAHTRYLRTIRYLILFFQGKKQLIRKQIEKEMNAYARNLEFEEASRLKKFLYALDHIHDIALIKNTNDLAIGDTAHAGHFRIEAYDVAHLSGMETVGTMVVSENGHLTPAEYRKFKMAKNTNDDLRNLEETLARRLNHSEWTYPDLIVVDGNAMHVERAEKVLKVRRINIPVVGVTKNDKHVADSFVGHPDIIARYKDHIVTLNAEAHRYTLAYHRKRRSMVHIPRE
ncbi:MAG: GIY-YIG nuclease family protein [Patescibacteria group bacterium]